MSDAPPIQVLSPRFEIEECLTEVRECLEKGWTGMGFKTVEIEEKWNEYTGHKYSHFLNSNTSGLELALCVLGDDLGWEEDAEIITTPFTFVSTNHVILHRGYTPVMADIDEYLCLDPESVKARITDKTRAIIYVGIGGNTGRWQEIQAIAKEAGVAVILDAAHMAGTRWNGKHVGPEADAAVYSFQAVKNMPTADSGMISFKQEKHDAAVRKYSWLGIDKDTFSRTSNQGSYKWYYDVEMPGYKYHGNAIMAGLALVALRYLDRDNDHRRMLASHYASRLEGIDGVNIVPIAPDCESSRHLFQIRVADRNGLYDALTQQNIFPGVHYRNNCEYRMYADQFDRCPEAAAASEEVISLPLHLKLTTEDVDRVCDAVIAALG